MIRFLCRSGGTGGRGIFLALFVLLLAAVACQASGGDPAYTPAPDLFRSSPGSMHAAPEDGAPPEGGVEGTPGETAPEQQQEQPRWPDAEQAQEEPVTPQNQPPIAPESPASSAPEAHGAPVVSPTQLPGASKDPASPAGISFERLKALEGVVQRFYRYSGERTVKGLVALFDQAPARQAGLSQQPAIAVSDGSTPLAIRLEPGLDDASFSFSGARSGSLVQQSDGSWTLECTPLKGRYVVYLSVLSGKNVKDLALTVIPPADEKIERDTDRFSEARVAQLVAATAAGEQERLVYDLNRDGKQNYLDDYILIGHYLLNLTSRTTPPQ